MVMIELCYCKITGRTRALPKVHHFIPLAPWTCNKIKGKRRQMNIDNSNNGPSSKYEKKEQIKLVLENIQVNRERKTLFQSGFLIPSI